MNIGAMPLDDSAFLMSQVFNALPIHIAVVDASGTILAVNDTWRRFATSNQGVAERTGKGANYFDACLLSADHPSAKQAAHAMDGIRKVLDGQFPAFEMEYDCHAAHIKHWFLMRVTPFEVDGQPRVAVAHIDITANKLVEHELRQRNRELSTTHHLGTRLLSLSNLKEAAQKTVDYLTQAIDTDMVVLFIRNGEELHLEATGSVNPVNVHCKAPVHRVGECLCGLAVKEKKSIFSSDIFSDPRCSGTECKVAGMQSFAAIPLLDRERVFGVLGVASATPRNFERMADFLGTIASEIAICLKNAQLIEVLQRQTEKLQDQRKTTEEARAALEINQKRFKGMLQRLQEAVYRKTIPEGRYEYMSPAAEKIFGYPPAHWVAHPNWIHEIVHPDFKLHFEADYQAILEGHIEPYYEYTIIDPQGGLRWIHETIAPVYDKSGRLIAIEGCCNDITTKINADAERRALEEQLIQAQKNEAIGSLAGGIAHDFNNILTSLIGHSELALTDLPAQGDVANHIREVLVACRRARELVNQILTFSRKKEVSVVSVEVRAILKEAVKFLRSIIPSSIVFTVRIHTRACTQADPTQIYQIIINLCTNAVHAMQETGGQLTIELTETKADNLNLPILEASANPLFICMSVIDSGPGIKAEICDRIFDPYFTTKGPGQGTGIGLSVVRGIVHSYGGDIRVASQPGCGTRFDVFLPVSDETRQETSQPTPELPLVRHARVLVVDDEPSILKMLQKVLTRSGMSVTAFEESQSALAHFSKDPTQYDIIITDLTMPQLSGDRLAQAVKEIAPHMPVVVTTGYGDRNLEERLTQIGVQRLLRKPFEKADIVRCVVDVLKSRGETS